jgi:hypothetical protein
MSIQQRVKHTQEYTLLRLHKSTRLDKFMTMTMGKCALEFATTGLLLDHKAFSQCRPEAVTVPTTWQGYKRLYNWEGFSYCYFCGLPQDRNRNGEAPACHRAVSYGVPCPFADFIFIVVWTLWHTDATRAQIIQDFGLLPDATYEQFAEWVVIEETMDGEYYKGLEVFIWYCERWLLSVNQR